MKRTNEMYKQCMLQSVKQDSTSTQVAYIPEKYAVVGKTVEFKTDGDWDGITWKVMSASDHVADGKKISKKFHRGWNNNIWPVETFYYIMNKNSTTGLLGNRNNTR